MTRNLKATVTIEADNQASPEIRKVESALGSLSGEVGGAIAKWASFSAAIAGAGLAFREIGQELVGQEQALARFSSALGVVGARSASAVEGAQAFAESVRRTAGISESTVLELQALAVAYTRNAEGARELTQAALDMAAALGISNEEAVRRLGASLTGNVEAISRFNASLGELSDEALRSGEAIRVIGEQFKGQLSASVDNAAGAFRTLGASLKDLGAEVALAIGAGQGGWMQQMITGLTRWVEAEREAREEHVRLRTELEATQFNNVSFKEFLDILLGIRTEQAIAAEHAVEYAAAQRQAAQATEERAVQEERLRAALAQQQAEAERVALLKEFGLTAAGTAIELDTLSTRLERLDAIFAGGARNSEAFARAQAVLVAQILEQAGGLERIEQLYRDGKISVTAYAEALALSAQQATNFAVNTRTSSTELERQGGVLDANTASLLRLSEAAAIASAQMAQVAVFSSRDFDRIAREQGRAAAVDAATAGGGRLVLGGTRVVFRGGSRLTREPGLYSALH